MPHILIIDDESNERAYQRIILTKSGHTVSEAGDADDGLREFQARPAELVICDLLLPDGQAADLVAAVRRESSSVKVIAVIGGTFLATGTEMTTGVDSMDPDWVLMRPFSAESLLNAVKVALAS